MRLFIKRKYVSNLSKLFLNVLLAKKDWSIDLFVPLTMGASLHSAMIRNFKRFRFLKLSESLRINLGILDKCR